MNLINIKTHILILIFVSIELESVILGLGGIAGAMVNYFMIKSSNFDLKKSLQLKDVLEFLSLVWREMKVHLNRSAKNPQLLLCAIQTRE